MIEPLLLLRYTKLLCFADPKKSKLCLCGLGNAFALKYDSQIKLLYDRLPLFPYSTTILLPRGLEDSNKRKHKAEKRSYNSHYCFARFLDLLSLPCLRFFELELTLLLAKFNGSSTNDPCVEIIELAIVNLEGMMRICQVNSIPSLQ
jgi:hypothetical protein